MLTSVIHPRQSHHSILREPQDSHIQEFLEVFYECLVDHYNKHALGRHIQGSRAVTKPSKKLNSSTRSVSGKFSFASRITSLANSNSPDST